MAWPTLAKRPQRDPFDNYTARRLLQLYHQKDDLEIEPRTGSISKTNTVNMASGVPGAAM